MADASYIGKGTIYLGPYDVSAKRRSIGNCSALTLSVEEDKKELLDYTSAGGGKANIVTRVSAVNVAMTLHDIDADNLAVAAFGAASAVTAAEVTAESHAKGYIGGLLRTAFAIDTAETVTVTGTGGTPTFTLNTHFSVTPAGIIILAAPSPWTDGSAVLITYDKDAGSVVQALTTTAQEYKLTFVGLNEAQSGKPVIVDLHRVKFGPLGELGLIGDEFAGLELSGEALSDTAITTAGLSKFFKVEIVS